MRPKPSRSSAYGEMMESEAVTHTFATTFNELAREVACTSRLSYPLAALNDLPYRRRG